MAHMFPKWYEINGVKCQGKLELAVATILFELDATFTRGSAIETPFGKYTPDFDCGTFFVEVKGQNTWLVACGVAPLMDNARDARLGKLCDKSLRKMEWVEANVKPVHVLIDTTTIRKAIRDLVVPEHSLTTVSGSNPEFRTFLMEKMNEPETYFA